MTISARLIARSTRETRLWTTPSWAPTRHRRIPECDAAADPGHLFPRHVAGSLSGDHPDVHRGWHPERLRVDLAFGMIVGASAQAALPASPERRYALREIKASRARRL